MEPKENLVDLLHMVRKAFQDNVVPEDHLVHQEYLQDVDDLEDKANQAVLDQLARKDQQVTIIIFLQNFHLQIYLFRSSCNWKRTCRPSWTQRRSW